MPHNKLRDLLPNRVVSTVAFLIVAIVDVVIVVIIPHGPVELGSDHAVGNLVCSLPHRSDGLHAEIMTMIM